MLILAKHRRAARLVCFCVLLFVVFGINAHAQNPVTWSVKTNAANASAGGKLTAQVSAQIAGGWHLYSITQGAGGPVPTRISVPEGQPFKLAGNISGPRPRVQLDPNFGINTETYEGGATFNVPVTVAADAATGAQQLNINVRFQACNDSVCLPPKTIKLSAPVTLATAALTTTTQPSPTAIPTPTPSPSPNKNANDNANAAASPTPTPDANTNENANSVVTPTDPVDPNVNAATGNTTGATNGSNGAGANASNNAVQFNLPTGMDGSLWWFIWTAMLGGAFALLTPCVFPMIPITASYFTSHAARNRSRAVRDAVIYALGIILTFTALGVVLAVLFGASGINKFAASPWVNLTITAIFLGFAFSLLGAYNLGVPSGLLTKLDSLSRGKETGRESGKIIGLLLMGLTFSLTSFTCTAPLVGTLLVLAAQGSWLYPVLGMLAFSTVFALPFFVLALAPQLVSQLPRSGGWLNSVKVVMGLLEIAAAMKFLSNVDLVWNWGIFTREVVLASWVAIALLIVVYLLGKFQLSHDMPTERIGALRLFIAVFFLSLGFYLLTGLFGARLGELESFLPIATSTSAVARTGGSSSSGELAWIENDYAGALAQAKKENKPIFIDFTGYTCTNCRWMEANMFPKTEVRRELEKYVRLRLFTDREGEPYEGYQQMQQDRYGTAALPLYVAVSPDDKPLATFAGLTRKPTDFVNFLKQGQDKFASAREPEQGTQAAHIP